MIVAAQRKRNAAASTNESDVTENKLRPRPASSRDATSPLNESPGGTENENDVTNDLESPEVVSNGGADITVPGISDNEKTAEILAPEQVNITCDLTPTPTLVINTDISQNVN